MSRTVSSFYGPGNNQDTDIYPITSGSPTAGDLIYYNKDGTYGLIPVSSAAGLNVTTTAPVTTLAGLGALGGERHGLANVYGGSLGKNVVAVGAGTGSHLIAYMDRQLGQPYFTVVSQFTLEGTPTFAPLSLSATFIDTTNSNICAATLTGGNVVIVWTNSAGGTANRVNYAIVNPTTGAITVAAAQDTAAGVAVTGTTAMRVVALATGGFVIAFASTTTVYARGYDSGGTATFAWVNTGAVLNTGSFNFGLAANSTGFIIAAPSSTANNVAYVVYTNAGGVSVPLGTFVSQIGTTTMGAVDVTVAGITEDYVIGYLAQGAASTYYPAYRRFTPSTVVFSAEYYVPAASTNMLNSGTTGAYGQVLTVYSLYNTNATTVDALYMGFAGSTSIGAAFVVFDLANNTCASGTFGTVSTTAPFNTAAVAHTDNSAFVPPNTSPVFVTAPNGALVDQQVVVWYTSTGNTSSLLRGMNYAYINLNTAAASAINYSGSGTTTVNRSNVIGTPSAYAPTQSSPTQASFSLAQTPSYFTPTVGAIANDPIVIDSISASGMAITNCGEYGTYTAILLARSNGTMRVQVYTQTSGVYSLFATYSTITDLNFFTAPASYVNQCVKIAAIQGTNYVVIAYATSATNVRTVLMDLTNGSLVGATVNITVTSMNMQSNSTTFDVSGLPINGNGVPRYVIGYNSSTGSRLAFAVYNGLTNAVVVTEQLVSAAATTLAAVGAFGTGGFLLACRDTTTTFTQVYTYGNPTANTFTQVLGATNLSGVAATTNNRFVASTNSGHVIVSDDNGSSGALGYVFAISGTIANYTLTITTTNGHFAVGFTGENAPVIFGHESGSPFNAAQRTSTLVGAVGSAQTTLASSLNNLANVSTTPCIAPGLGATYAVVYRNSFYQPVFAVITGAAISNFATIPAATYSTPLPIYPIASTATTPAITNTVLVGTFIKDNVVQTKGYALTTCLGSSTTKAFDFTKQAVPGIKGTINNSNIYMAKDI